MMITNSVPNRKDWLILLCTGLLVLLPLAVGGVYVAQKHKWAQARLAELNPRYARLQGLDEQRKEVDEALESNNAARAEFVYSSEMDAGQTGNAVQRRMRDIFTAAGLTVVSSQVLPSKEEKGFDRIPLSVRAEGDLLAVDSALSVLNEQLPVVLINDVEIRNQGSLQSMNAKVAPRLTLQITMSVLRVQK